MKKIWMYKILMIFIFISNILDFCYSDNPLPHKIDMFVTGLLIIYALYLVLIYKQDEELVGFRPNQLGTRMILGILIGFVINISFDVKGNDALIVSFSMLVGAHIGFKKTIFKNE